MNRQYVSISCVSVGFLTLAAAGCSKGLPPKMDLPQARVALTTALDAWKEGQAPESLRARQPPIDFRDVAWEQGNRLLRYEVAKEETAGLSARFTVQLSLVDAGGATRSEAVIYNADAGSMIVIRPNF